MALFDQTIMDKAGKSNWLVGADFENGQTLKIKSVETVKSDFGASADSSIVEREILKEGEVFRYTFEDASGEEKVHDSHSMPFFIAMQGAEFNFGDWLLIKRTGKLRDTRYTADKVEAPVSHAKDDITPAF